jgi:hypothetical protein
VTPKAIKVNSSSQVLEGSLHHGRAAQWVGVEFQQIPYVFERIAR